MGQRLTHLDEAGHARMVDVSEKSATTREAVAQADLHMLPETLTAIREMTLRKGDVLAVARVAAIQATKRTSELIPLCHPLALRAVEANFIEIDEKTLRILVTVKTTGVTGVEMEALVGATVGALTVYDMCKAIDRGMVIREACLLKKIGGKSGPYEREQEMSR
ncbi:cyclic pyranopterin monophosphate synthase MoaC [Ferroacidibacillus organovorans]|uniref:Cyclic pyranopterin monophosphate synthase n=1 Tax=Ferroacidibacillus organovorans TaxID=1765683 RepID=A0A101XRV0_9BACL|nr:cyclic pyranopterin monophosphate synthase MoaC [Ferroacidibacillus organovorans]KUO96384.1 cyclic pyranopterin monophosphate synthase accessory protein [Ferroacidibacillus organovorans]